MVKFICPFSRNSQQNAFATLRRLARQTGLRWLLMAACSMVFFTAALVAQDPSSSAGIPAVAALSVTSPTFTDNALLPANAESDLLGCHGQNHSLALAWGQAPAGTKSFALEMIEPDSVSGVDYTHWLVMDLPPETHSLPEGAGNTNGPLPPPAILGYTDAAVSHYAGPCPQPGQDRPHHYVVTVYALSVPTLGLEKTATLPRLHVAIRGKVLAQGTITGLFGGPPGSKPASPVVELMEFQVKPRQESGFRTAMQQALPLVARQPGHLGDEFGPAVDKPSAFLLRVRWASLADQAERFQNSPDSKAFSTALRPFLTRPAVVSDYAAGVAVSSADPSSPRLETPSAPAVFPAMPGLPYSVAQEAATAAVTRCAADKHYVTAVILDPSAVMQVVARGDGATPYAVESARLKAYTILNLGPIRGVTSTTALANEVLSDPKSSQLVHIPGILLEPGGVTITRPDGVIVAAIGVAGSPAGSLDDDCA